MSDGKKRSGAKNGKTKSRKGTSKRAKAGQPTKYKPEFCQAIIEYFDVEPWETPKIEYYEHGKVVRIEEGKRQYRIMPSLLRFAKSIKVCYATIYNWVDPKHASFQPKFLDAYNTALEIRKEWLINVGLSGLAPANSFKFVAVNLTDMRDKQDVEHSGGVNVIIDR